jgi:hypothetical protein
VPEIKVRNAARSEFSFNSVEEIAELIRSGGITMAWEIYHSAASRWLPITRHPLFAAAVLPVQRQPNQ